MRIGGIPISHARPYFIGILSVGCDGGTHFELSQVDCKREAGARGYACRLLHAHRTAAALVHARDRLDWVRAALFVADSREALLDRGPVDAAGALIGIDVIGDAAARLVQTDLTGSELFPIANVVAGRFAIAPRVRESIDDGRIVCRRRIGGYRVAVLRVLATHRQYANAHQRRNGDSDAKYFHDEPPSKERASDKGTRLAARAPHIGEQIARNSTCGGRASAP